MLYTDGDGLLIDAGVGIRTLKKHFQDYGLQLQQVKHILVTHDHADHVKSVGKISGDCNLPVYATREVHQGILQNYCVRKKITPINTKLIEKNKPFQLGDFRITAFSVPHDSADNVGYDLRSEAPDGTKRYIEVKGRSGTDGVMLSSNEMFRLGQLGNRAWLYIVTDCKTHPKLSVINDPARNLNFEKKIKGVQFYLPLEEWQAHTCDL